MSTNLLLTALRRHWPLLLAGLLLGGALGAGLTAALPHKSQASSVLLISAPGITPAIDGSGYVEERMATYAELITTQPVLDAAGRATGLPAGAIRRRDVEAQVPPATLVINLTVTWSDPVDAADIANAVAQAFVAQAPRLDNARRPVLQVAVVEEALPQNSVTSLPVLLPVLVGLVLGLTTAIVVAVARTAHPRRVRSVDEAAQLTGSTPLAVVSWSKDPAGDGLAVGPPGRRAMRTGQSTSDPFAVVHSRLALGSTGGHEGSPRVVTVVATTDRREAVAVAAGLAGTCASSGQVCLVLTLEEETQALLDEVTRSSAAETAVATASRLIGRAGVVVTDDELLTAVRAARPEPDVVVVCASPVDADPSTRTAIRCASDVVLALPLRSARHRAATHAVHAVREAGKSLAGSVLLVEEARGHGTETPQQWA